MHSPTRPIRIITFVLAVFVAGCFKADQNGTAVSRSDERRPAILGSTHADGDGSAIQAHPRLSKVGFTGVPGHPRAVTEGLVSGTYEVTDSLEIISSEITLDSRGDADSVVVFQLASMLIATADRGVNPSAQGFDDFWQVDGSSIPGTGSVFPVGMSADPTMTTQTVTTLDARTMAWIASTTLNTHAIARQ